MLSVLVIDDSRVRAVDLCAALALAGYQVAAVLDTALDLPGRVKDIKPDIVLIHTDSPSRDTLEHLAVVNRDFPRPMLMISDSADDDVLRQAMRAGVSAYLGHDIDPVRLEPVMRLAKVQFEEFQALRKERDDANRKLTERVTIDKAKGLIMKARGLDEEAAYHALRRLAMDQGRKVADVARDIIAAASLLL